jgi:hypothetical protein
MENGISSYLCAYTTRPSAGKAKHITSWIEHARAIAAKLLEMYQVPNYINHGLTRRLAGLQAGEMALQRLGLAKVLHGELAHIQLLA